MTIDTPITPDVNSSHGNGLKPVFFAFARMLVGAPLVISGLVHFANPYQYLESVLRYDFVPVQFATTFAALMMCLCLCTGLSLIFDWFRKGALLVAAFLFSAFSIGQLLALSRGLTILCGCFGTFSHKVTWFSFSTLVGMAAVSIILFQFGPKVDGKV